MNFYQKTRLANLVRKNEVAKDSLKTKIAVFGFGYKKNTSDTRTTPVAMFVHTLAKRGFQVAVHDPQVTQKGFEAEMVEQGLDYNLENKENFLGKIEFFGSDIA